MYKLKLKLKLNFKKSRGVQAKKEYRLKKSRKAQKSVRKNKKS